MLLKGLNLLATTRLDCSVETTNLAWASKFDEMHCEMMRVRKKNFRNMATQGVVTGYTFVFEGM